MQLRHKSLLVIVTALLPTYLIRFEVFGVPTNLLEILIAATFLIGLSQPEIRGQWKAAWSALPRQIKIAIGLFLLATIISTATSPHLHTSLGILKGWIFIPILFAWMVFAACNQITNYKLQITNTLIASGTVTSLFAFSQIGQLDRLRGPFDVPNSLALFLAPLIVLAVGSAIKNYNFRITNYKLQIAAIIMFLALLGTESLAGIASVITILVATHIRSYREYKLQATSYKLLPFVILLMLTAVVAAPKIEYLTQPNSSAAVRLQLWSVSWELVQEHPILGVGLGTFEPAYQQKLHQRFAQYKKLTKLEANEASTQPLAEWVFRDPHNWPLSFWLNTGLLGLLSFIYLHAWLFNRLRITNYKLPPPALALATLLIFGLVDTIFWKNDLATLHFVLVALALHSPRKT